MNRVCWLMAVVLVSAAGCGETFGGLLYHLSLLPQRRMPARFELTKGPLLILVDDDLELVTWPPARGRLVDEVGRHLHRVGANRQALPSQAVETLRHGDPKFATRSISDIGRMAGAEQVLWIQIREFVATRQIESTSNVARFTLRVKVFDPHAEDKPQMRLWPAYREGEVLSLKKGATEVGRLNSDQQVAEVLVDDMADAVAKLFYTHAIEE